jgi:hypothetical protein
MKYFTFLVNASLKLIYALLISNVKVINILIFECKSSCQCNFTS